jgi:ATP-dependent 26S proteasome regulatory subunit
MNEEGLIGEARVIGMELGDEIPEFIQNIFGSAGLNKRQRDELIKTYLDVKNLGDTVRTYKKYPYTFNRAISDALEDLSRMAKNVRKTKGTEGAPMSYSLDEEGSRFDDAFFGGEFSIGDASFRAVIESVSMQKQGIMIMPAGMSGGNYTSLSIYTKKGDRIHVSDIFAIVDEYVGEKNPLKGKVIDINGEEENIGDYDWGDIAIPDYFKEEVEENIIWPVMYHEKIRAANLRVPRGLMLEGERGMGKTLLSKIIANKIKGKNTTFIKAKPSDIQRLKWNYVFEIATTLEPSVLYIEDIETLTPSKQTFGLSLSLTDALDYLDGTEERSNVMFLASTNTPEMVDLGVIDRPGRIDRRLVFDPTNKEYFGMKWKEDVFKIHLRGHGLEEGLAISELARMIGDHPYTGSHIEELIHTATLEALRRSNIDDISEEEIKEKIVLTREDFEHAKMRVERIIRRAGPEVS